MDEFIEMDLDTWWDTYKPKTNPVDPMASYDGCMFETHGSELEFIRTINPKHVWTLGDGDDGGMYIWNGYSIINRIGYFITGVPCPDDTTIQVLVSHNWYYCENCGSETEDPDNLIRDAFQDANLDRCLECATAEELAASGYKPAG